MPEYKEIELKHKMNILLGDYNTNFSDVENELKELKELNRSIAKKYEKAFSMKKRTE
jgi:hypothetical protein